jgi:signal transduction histidine kinase
VPGDHESADEQQQKLAALGRLAEGVAHDFNNLLTAIGGYAELLQLKLDNGDERRAYVDEIRNACERATVLTNRLLAVASRQAQRLQTIELNELVGGAESSLRMLLGESIELVLELDPERASVRADRQQLELVLRELARNAGDAMPEGGSLTISTRRDPPWAVLTVTDTGSGMDETTRRHAFEPFFTSKQGGEGTGLGLAEVYGVVTQTGGTVELESRPAEGSTFRVYLPLDAGSPAG